MYCFPKANGLLININNYKKSVEWHFINAPPRVPISRPFKPHYPFPIGQSSAGQHCVAGTRKALSHFQDDPGRRGPSSPARQSPLQFSFVLVFLHRLPTFLRLRFISFIGHSSGVTELYGQICYGTGNQMK